jgi:hypothetical protein
LDKFDPEFKFENNLKFENIKEGSILIKKVERNSYGLNFDDNKNNYELLDN